jgi:hypothetical protein
MPHAAVPRAHGSETGAGFAAGTLVHTQQGLKPIEQIQVGDWVLSKPEGGGEQACKRVLQTVEHPPQRVVAVVYVTPGQDVPQLIATIQRFETADVVSTPNHRIWTREEGWTAAINLQGYGSSLFHFEGKLGEEISYFTIQNIHVSDQPGVGWTSTRMTVRTDDLGNLWDYVNHKWVAMGVLATESVQYFWDTETIDENLYFTLPVYNLEVEDFHTYYVGEHGLWVHSRNGGG